MPWPWQRKEADDLLPELRAVRDQLDTTLDALQRFDARLQAVAEQCRTDHSPRPTRWDVLGE